MSRTASDAPPAASTGVPAASPYHFPCFDGLRTIAVLSAVVTHVGFVTGATVHSSYGRYIAHLEIGPALFFLISGFLLYRSYALPSFEGRPVISTRPFLRRRALRIVPAYWLALTGLILLFGLPVSGWRDFVTYYFFLQIYDTERFLGAIPQAWTLCTEVSFYLFLPAYAWALRRFGAGQPLAVRFRRELLGAGALVGVSVVWRAAWWFFDGRNPMARIAVHWLPGYLDVFGAGMALAIVSAWVASRGETPAFLQWVGKVPWLWWLVALFSYWVVATQLGLPLAPRPENTPIWAQAYAQHFLQLSFAFFITVPAVFGPQDRGLVRRFLQFGPITYIGLVSYGVYLWHEGWLHKSLEWTGRPGILEILVTGERVQSSTFPIILVLTVLLSIVTATLSYYLVERPVLRLKNRSLRELVHRPGRTVPT
jgi:peptidoglycan/LPS O-acetylase OafA/YrhL